MSQFDDFTKKAASFAGLAMKRSSSVVGAGKIKLRISAEEKKISELYEKVGRAIYEDVAAGGPVIEFVREDCVEIYNHFQAIAEMEAQIEAMKQEVEQAAAAHEAPPAATSFAEDDEDESGKPNQ